MHTRSKILHKVALSLLIVLPALAQAPPPPPSYNPPQLDQMVSRIALYPDPLLAQVLAAATYPDQIPDAARWADEHHYMTGDALANAINQDQLPWDPSVQALLPFPSVLAMMASDLNWTGQLGDAFLAQEQDVMDAVQRMRARARDYGYLSSNGQVTVSGGPYIAIEPVNPAFIYVPYYDPAIVFVGRRPGYHISFRFGISIGPAYRPWGWGTNNFDWGRHVVIINNEPWRRTWVNRRDYVHPYPQVHRIAPPPRPARGPAPRIERPAEQHQVHQETQRERQAAEHGQKRVEEHREERRPANNGKGNGNGNGKGRGKGGDDRR